MSEGPPTIEKPSNDLLADLELTNPNIRIGEELGESTQPFTPIQPETSEHGAESVLDVEQLKRIQLFEAYKKRLMGTTIEYGGMHLKVTEVDPNTYSVTGTDENGIPYVLPRETVEEFETK